MCLYWYQRAKAVLGPLTHFYSMHNSKTSKYLEVFSFLVLPLQFEVNKLNAKAT